MTHEHHWWLEDSVTGQVLVCLCGVRREIGRARIDNARYALSQREAKDGTATTGKA